MLISLLFLFCCTGSYSHTAKKEEAEEPWDISAGMDYLSRYFKYGVDLGADQPALDWHVDLSHEKGWLLGGDFVNVMDGSGFQEGFLYGGYEYDFSDAFFLRGELAHYFYS
ncbi:MAG TPA: TorF family putative porin, partial [Candidatus Kapabacteria bacterium]|nr:TorF family putative porin [Candidatus Kapabacteria bacterium]